jgi:hypothetical protein
MLMADLKYEMKRVSVITYECTIFANVLEVRAVLGVIQLTCIDVLIPPKV